ncbi:hypothetical protein [Paenibacillus dokdonensis]|uniref:hypothetical protein n=1 Tax=Paenibacillus dokdonensis TaxID=2567944 RepID=UPI001457D27C|nr:hypothetical protein [Paenibacillus dokdonensis]
MKREELSRKQQQLVEKQLAVISRGTVDIIPEEGLKKKLLKSVVTRISSLAAQTRPSIC